MTGNNFEKNRNEIDALVKLLEDPDAEISQLIEDRLLYYGDEAIEYLESIWEKSFDVTIQHRLEEIIHKIQFEKVKVDLSLWLLSGSRDLLEGVLIVNRYQYPDLKKEKILLEFEELKREAWLHFGYEMSPLEKVNVLNHVLYQVKGFSGNTAHHQDPQNSYINLVLETRKGNQLSLAIIYSIVAQSIGVPIYGVNLPQHFILAYLNEGRADANSYEMVNDVVFYINAFNRGFVFNRNDVDFFLKQLGQPAKDEFYYPCANKAIILRLIHNLISSYEKLGYESKVIELRELARVME